MTPTFRRSASGFTLTELAVVLAIIALLIGGLMVPLSTQQDLRGRQDTDKALTDIREALIGFAAINGRLPCPAPATLADGTTGAGLEATTAATGTTTTTGPCGCTSATSGIVQAGGTACDDSSPTASLTGVLPWATLGVPELDAWGHRYTYRVTTRFARAASGQTTFGSCTPSTNPSSAAFALCSAGDVVVLTAASGGSTVAGNVPAIVVSHGKNGAGAYTSDGTQIAAATAGTDEAENTNGDVNFVSNTAIDDQLVWLSTSVLMNRMVTAGKLP